MLRLLEGAHDLPVAQPQEQVLPSDFVVRRIMTVMSQTTNDGGSNLSNESRTVYQHTAFI